MKTKKFFQFLSLTLCVALGAFLVGCAQETKTASYDEENPSSAFVSIEASEANTLENAFLLFGRPSCTDCQEFYPYLAKASIEENVKIYYVDTDNQDMDNPDDPITKAREQYQSSEYVPSLVYVNNGQTVKAFFMDEYVRFGTELVPDEEKAEENRLNSIKEFLKDPETYGVDLVDGVVVFPDDEEDEESIAVAESVIEQ